MAAGRQGAGIAADYLVKKKKVGQFSWKTAGIRWIPQTGLHHLFTHPPRRLGNLAHVVARCLSAPSRAVYRIGPLAGFVTFQDIRQVTFPVWHNDTQQNWSQVYLSSYQTAWQCPNSVWAKRASERGDQEGERERERESSLCIMRHFSRACTFYGPRMFC